MPFKNAFSRKKNTSSDNQTVAAPEDTEMINEQLREIPEIAEAKYVSYYRYPILDTYWLEPKHVIQNEPGFVRGSNDGVKKNYAHGNGRKGIGYYHLMTQEAWKALAKRYSDRDVAWLLKQRATSKFRNDRDPTKPAKPLGPARPSNASSPLVGFAGAGLCF